MFSISQFTTSSTISIRGSWLPLLTSATTTQTIYLLGQTYTINQSSPLLKSTTPLSRILSGLARVFCIFTACPRPPLVLDRPRSSSLSSFRSLLIGMLLRLELPPRLFRRTSAISEGVGLGDRDDERSRDRVRSMMRNCFSASASFHPASMELIRLEGSAELRRNQDTDHLSGT